MSAKKIAAQVRAAKSPADVTRITQGLTPKQEKAVISELERDTK